MIDSSVAAPPRRRWPSSRTPCGWMSFRTPARIGPAFVRPGLARGPYSAHESEGAIPCATSRPSPSTEEPATTSRSTRRSRPGIVLTGTEIKSLRAGKVQAVRRVRARRARRGVAHRRPYRPVRAGEPLQPRAEAEPQAPAPPLRDRRAPRPGQGQGPDDRPAAAVHQPEGPGQGRARPGAGQAAPRPPARHRRPGRPARRRARARRRPARRGSGS